MAIVISFVAKNLKFEEHSIFSQLLNILYIFSDSAEAS